MRDSRYFPSIVILIFLYIFIKFSPVLIKITPIVSNTVYQLGKTVYHNVYTKVNNHHTSIIYSMKVELNRRQGTDEWQQKTLRIINLYKRRI